jgi:NAD-dependent SIR2 family protein deacetylase
MATIQGHRFDVTCARCGHAWLTKPCFHDQLPARCPRCKAVGWQRRAAALGVTLSRWPTRGRGGTPMAGRR